MLPSGHAAAAMSVDIGVVGDGGGGGSRIVPEEVKVGKAVVGDAAAEARAEKRRGRKRASELV